MQIDGCDSATEPMQIGKEENVSHAAALDSAVTAAAFPTNSTVTAASFSTNMAATDAALSSAAPLRVCFRSCVMPQPSAHANRNNYRVFVYQGPFQGRTGFVIREEQEAVVEDSRHTGHHWQSIIEGDDGKEPFQYTASNRHLRMVAALDRSGPTIVRKR